VSTGPHAGSLYRYQNPDGTSKDWAICDGGDGNIYVYFGKTGKKLQMRIIPPSRFSKLGIAEEIEHRTGEQIYDGYNFVSQVQIVDGVVTSVSSDPQLSPIEWEMARKIDSTELCETLAKMVEALGSTPYPGTTVNYEKESLVVKNGTRVWRFGIVESMEGGISRTTGRGGGRVLPEHGPIPLLVLMTMDASFPGTFVFGDEQGNTVKLRLSEDDPWFSPGRVAFGKLRAAAAKLGIVAPSMSELNVRSTGVWF
jgi:hypothetical protein